MKVQPFVGHETVVERFRRSAEQGRLAGTYLFVGPAGVGKRTFALFLAQALLCEVRSEQALDPCGNCSGCVQVLAGTHPDLDVIQRSDEKSVIQIEQLVGDREHRNQEGFCYRISLKPYSGRRRVGIIDDADDLNEEAANCLLKTLEEPPPGAVLILIASSLQRQLPTIRSRAQIVPFLPLSHEQVASILRDRQLVEDEATAETLAQLSGGSLQQALEFADPEVLENRNRLLQVLAQGDFDPIPAAKDLQAFAGETGTEAAVKRRRLRQVFVTAAEFYRQLLRVRLGLAPEGDPQLRAAAEAAGKRPHWNVRTIGECVERCLQAEQQVAANANQATLIEAWLDDLNRHAIGNR